MPLNLTKPNYIKIILKIQQHKKKSEYERIKNAISSTLGIK